VTAKHVLPLLSLQEIHGRGGFQKLVIYNFPQSFSQRNPLASPVEKGNPATPLYEFKEPFKKLFSSQNAFLIISERRKRKKRIP
jgi:hypothetical protein